MLQKRATHTGYIKVSRGCEKKILFPSGENKLDGHTVTLLQTLYEIFVHFAEFSRTKTTHPTSKGCGLSEMSRVMRKPVFAYAKTKRQISFVVTAKLISAFVFATWIVQFLYCLNLKFQASSHLLWLYSPVCVGPGRKPRGPVFSHRGSNVIFEDAFDSKLF